MSTVILFNKPYNVLCQFRDKDHRTTLADYITLPNVYPAGRLDRDSEGLLVLTDSGALQHYISHPNHYLKKSYWVQVEGVPHDHALQQLRQGVQLKEGLTQPAQVSLITPPTIWHRSPPIRQRQHIATQWLSITLQEGKNRQIRRMTAAVGHPTLRLIRYAIGDWQLDQLASGKWQYLCQQAMVKLHHDMDSSHHRRRRHRTRSTISDGRRIYRQSTHSQSTRRSSRSRRKPH